MPAQLLVTQLCSETGEKTPGMTPPGTARGEIELRRDNIL